MHVPLEVRGIFNDTLLPLTLKTSLNKNLVNIFNPTLNTGSLSFIKYLSLKFQISATKFLFLNVT